MLTRLRLNPPKWFTHLLQCAMVWAPGVIDRHCGVAGIRPSD